MVHFPGRFLLVAVFVTSIVAMTVLLSVALPVEAADCLSERPRPQLLRPPLQRKHILFISRSRTKLQEACFESEDFFFVKNMLANNNHNNNNSGSSSHRSSSPSVNMGVAWFYQPACPVNESAGHSPMIGVTDNNNRLKLSSPAKSNDNCKEDYVDIIDIEDEDHSFAAFFIGMKTGPSPYVKRPLVQLLLLFFFTFDFSTSPNRTLS